jgi:glucose/arabinose dehydrogenase
MEERSHKDRHRPHRREEPDLRQGDGMGQAWRRAVGANAAPGLMLALVAACDGAAGPQGSIRLEPVIDGLTSPLYLTHAGDHSGRLFVVEQTGRILVLQPGTRGAQPFLEIGARVRSGGERGLLGLAFHPRFAENGRLFVDYTRAPDGATVIAEYRVGPDGRADASSERVLLTIAQPYANHNGGMVAFGPDGFLYIGMGDGGSAGDPQNRAQNPNELLGKILRIDVDHGEPYGIPTDNPYARGGGRPEIYAIGLRNPWRFSFDRKTGELWAADVGQNAIEEIDLIKRGGNYGWHLFEGTHRYAADGEVDLAALTMPIAEYGHDDGRCSITGGYVYRGQAIPALAGTYIFGDYCSGDVFGLKDGRQTVLLETSMSIASFGEDAAGEVYLVDLDGAVYRIVASSEARP